MTARQPIDLNRLAAIVKSRQAVYVLSDRGHVQIIRYLPLESPRYAEFLTQRR